MDIPQPWILSTDRTEWSFGSTRFNILMLGVVHDGVAYPLIWEMLEKKGNSQSEERMDLLDRFDKIFPDAQIAYICGDREFVGKQWLTYLLIELRSIVADSTGLRTVEFSPDGKIIASGGTDRDIKLWTRKGELINTLQGHQGIILDVEFSADGSKIASASAKNYF